ncbi:UNVERIFIED_CONTAM: hypothetical protein H355_000221 [Colinus virginianus]|nr:hypothetical protein H355_000221 [Colinus virginianus]
MIYRNCTEVGWSPPSPPYYSACELEAVGNNNTEAKASYFITMKVLYTCGYSTSLVALLLAVAIFSCFRRLTKSTLLLIPLFGVHYVVFALFPEHIGVDARLYFELVLGSYQVQAEIKRNWGKWQSSMESNVFNMATQDFTA